MRKGPRRRPRRLPAKHLMHPSGGARRAAMTASWSRPILSAVSSHPCNCHVYLWALKALPKECISQNLWAKGHEPCSIALLLCTGMRLCRVCTCSQPSRPGATFSASLPGCGAEVAQKKVARKPKEHTFFLLRYWRLCPASAWATSRRARARWPRRWRASAERPLQSRPSLGQPSRPAVLLGFLGSVHDI